MMGFGMKGQYFSFDAIVATVIMVVAMTSLTAYWYGVQSVVDSHSNPLYGNALRIAESLLSKGSPDDWQARNIDEIRQFGIAGSFGNDIDKARVEKLEQIVAADYEKAGNILHAPSDYHIIVEQADAGGGFAYSIGKPAPLEATEVVIAHRGGVLDGKPARIQVVLWR